MNQVGLWESKYTFNKFVIHFVLDGFNMYNFKIVTQIYKIQVVGAYYDVWLLANEV